MCRELRALAFYRVVGNATLTRSFLRFCVVGGGGVVVDMVVLSVLVDPRLFGLSLALGKVCSGEIALVNNFVWNEVWTFRGCGAVTSRLPVEANGSSSKVRGTHDLAARPLLRRFLLFHAICIVGLGLAVLVVTVLRVELGWNLYLANLAAIACATLWNFALNFGLNWRVSTAAFSPAQRTLW